MLSLGHQHQLLPYVVAMVAALSVQEVFTETHTTPTTDIEVSVSYIFSNLLFLKAFMLNGKVRRVMINHFA
jgi:hypothetical protein